MGSLSKALVLLIVFRLKNILNGISNPMYSVSIANMLKSFFFLGIILQSYHVRDNREFGQAITTLFIINIHLKKTDVN